MRRFLPKLLGLGAAMGIVAAASACVGTTGSDLVTFKAAAAGPSAVTGHTYTFHTARGYTVTLTTATIHLGGVYLNIAKPLSGAQSTDCINPGLYVAEVTAGLDVDTLNPTPQPFATKGEGTETLAVDAEVWLTHGEVNDVDDATPMVTLAGQATADADGKVYPFTGSITIGDDKLAPITDVSQPSLHPICKERIVSGIDVAITPTTGGSLLLRVDPAGWFTNVNFSQLTASKIGTGYAFDDTLNDQPDKNVYLGFHANSGVYDFEWVDSPNP